MIWWLEFRRVLFRAIAKIDAAVWQAEVVQDGLQFFFRNRFTNHFIHLVGHSGGFFDAQPGARAKVYADLPGVYFGEKVSAKHKNQSCGKQAESEETRREYSGTGERGVQGAAVALPKALKAVLEGLLVAAEKTLLFSLMVFRMGMLFRGGQGDCL